MEEYFFNIGIKSIKIKRIPIKKFDFLKFLDSLNLNLFDKQLLAISSKIIAISQGRFIPINKYYLSNNEIYPKNLIKKEADFLVDGDPPFYLAKIYNTFIPNAGVDISNADGHYILLPSNLEDEIIKIQQFLLKKYNLQNLGIIVTDSYCSPFRKGTMSISLCSYGFNPIYVPNENFDLFDKELKVTSLNVVDSLTHFISLFQGEGNEATPLTILSNLPDNVVFGNYSSKDLAIEDEQDVFYPLIKPYLSK